jgi:hypothetical protein
MGNLTMLGPELLLIGSAVLVLLKIVLVTIQIRREKKK